MRARRTEAIYRRPADAFVAGFIGGFSLLPGQAGGGQFQAQAAGVPPLRTASTLSGAVNLVIRPEGARPATGHPDNTLTGPLASQSFQGRCWRLALAVGDSRVRLDWPQAVAPGGDLTFSLAPEDCTLVGQCNARRLPVIPIGPNRGRR
jgi:ABC-type Fe3+/spermidine/putrescine transport system ATPase subunit